MGQDLRVMKETGRQRSGVKCSRQSGDEQSPGDKNIPGGLKDKQRGPGG